MLRHLGAAIEARGEKLIAHLPAALEGDVEGAHASRVAARRLAEVLPLLRSRKAERLRADVRQVRQALGARRELAVTRALLVEEAARWRWPAVLVAHVTRHLDARQPAINEAAEASAQVIDIPRLHRRLTRIARQAGAEDYPLLMARLRRRRVARERALARALKAAGTMYEVERLHDVRIAAKKLRYVLEAQVECAGRGAVARIHALKILQDDLGRLHDLQVLEAVVREVEGRFVSGRGRVGRGLARIGTDLETECRRLHAHALSTTEGMTHGTTFAVPGPARDRRRTRR